MTEDWVTDYMSQRKSEQTETEIELKKAKRSEEGAPRLFRALSNRIQSDIKQYHVNGGNQDLFYFFTPSNKFAVRKSNYPSVTLEVELKEVAIEYSYRYKIDGTVDPKITEGHFLVKADLSGNVQVVQGGVAFVDVSDVSEALLKPVFDFVK